MAATLGYKRLLNAQSALNTVGNADGDKQGVAFQTAIYVVFNAGTSAGVVVVETSHDPNYTGTWANLATVTWAAATKCHVVQITGNYLALRVRISTAIVGGTVDAHLVQNR